MLISGIFCPLSLTLFHPHPLLLPGSHIKKVVPLKKSGFVKLHIFSVKYTYVRDATFPPSILLSESEVHNQGLHHILESRWLWLNFFGRGLLVWKTFGAKGKPLLYSSWNYGGDQGLLWKAAKTLRFFWESSVNAPPCGVDISSFFASLYPTCAWF